MAIWQFEFLLIPTEWAEGNASRITRRFLDEGWELGAAWSESDRREVPEVVIDQYMPRGRSWHADMTAWGDDETDDIQLWREAEEIDVLEIRIDARNDFTLMVQHSVSIARELNCSFLLRKEGIVIEPTAEQLVSSLQRSTAMRFVSDPLGALEDLPPVRLPKYRPH